MNGDESSLARQFEQKRSHLRSLAYRMLGSRSEAEDAVQEAWLRLSRADARSIDNLGGWLTTVVARVALDMLRSRRSEREHTAGMRFPDPIVWHEERGGAAERQTSLDEAGIPAVQDSDPERDAIHVDSIGLALLVVLETLDPAERLAFVLHDTLDVPFEEIAAIVGKTPAAARQLASRARRHVQRATTSPDADMRAQREVVAAFLAAARAADFDALLRVLDPDVVVRFDLGATSSEVRGAEPSARNALLGARLSASVEAVIVNGSPGLLSFDASGQPRSLLAFTVTRGKITQILGFGDPERLRAIVGDDRTQTAGLKPSSWG